MRFTKSRSLAAISAAIAALACFAAQAAPPRYGGTLHVRLRASSVSLDPGEWTPGSLSSAASEKLASLVCDLMTHWPRQRPTSFERCYGLFWIADPRATSLC